MFNVYRVYIEELNRYVNFVDRVLEIEKLFDVVRRGTVFPLVIYGSEGCGKTALLRYIVKEVSGWDNYVVVYVDALEQFDIEKAIFSTHREVLEFVQHILSIPIGSTLARTVMSLISRLAKKISLIDKKVLVVIDDVYRAIGFEDVERYTKSLYEWIGYLHEKYGVDRVAIVMTTSEGVSKRLLARHTYVSIEMLWNLSRDGFEELVEQLSPPQGIDLDVLWRLTGGNPRALIEIAKYGWDIDKWIDIVYENRVKRTLHIVDRDKLRRLVEDPDSDWKTAEELEDMGLMIELKQRAVVGQTPKPDPELGIGKNWAWQIPVYKYIVKKHLKTG